MFRTHYSNEVGPEMDGEEIKVAGWVSKIRDLGNIKFISLRDRYGYLQIVLPRKKVSQEVLDSFSKLTNESVISVDGVVKRSEKAKAGFEILPTRLEILSVADTPLPMDVSGKIESEMDTRLDNRFMDLRLDRVKAIFMIRNLFVDGIRRYMQDNGFVEVATPKIAAAGAEGGASLFPVQYFDQWAFLTQSPQLYKQMLMASGLDAVYEIAPAFRAEPSDTSRHLSEFTSFDFELAFIEDQEDVMRIVEDCFVFSLKWARDKGKTWLKVLEKDIQIPGKPFPRVSFDEARSLLAKEGFSVKEDFGTDEEKALGRIMAQQGHEAFFVVDYPEVSRGFYYMEKEGGLTNSFDLLYKGEELATGGQREHRYDALVARMKRKGLDPRNFEFYLKAFRYGMPPHGGVGLGVDRLVAKALDLPNIREVVLFPRDQWRLVP